MKLWIYEAASTPRLIDSLAVDVPPWGDEGHDVWLTRGRWDSAASASVGDDDCSYYSGLAVNVYRRTADADDTRQYLIEVYVGDGFEIVLCQTLWDYLAFMQAQAPLLAVALRQTWRILDEDSNPKTRND